MQAVKRCEFFTYGLDTEDCNLYESDAEAGHLEEDPNFIHGPRICPTGEVMGGCGQVASKYGFRHPQTYFQIILGIKWRYLQPLRPFLIATAPRNAWYDYTFHYACIHETERDSRH